MLQVSGGMFRVLNTHTDHSLGGESFTEALAQHLAAEFRRSVCVLSQVQLALALLPLVS